MRIEPGSLEGMDEFFLYTVDNFLSPSYLKAIHTRIVNGNHFQLCENTSYPEADSYKTDDPTNTFDVGQIVYSVLTDGLVLDANMYAFLEPMLFQAYDAFPEYLFKGVNRIKANGLVVRPDRGATAYNTPHVDINTLRICSFLYYLNDADGDTVFFKERITTVEARPTTFTEVLRVKPKANTLVFFNSSYYHASSNPQSGSTRFVLNCVLDAERIRAVDSVV